MDDSFWTGFGLELTLLTFFVFLGFAFIPLSARG
jgi:hypothetical protein